MKYHRGSLPPTECDIFTFHEQMNKMETKEWDGDTQTGSRQTNRMETHKHDGDKGTHEQDGDI